MEPPTLVVHGDADVSAPIDHTGRRVAAIAPNATLEVLPGAGHGLHAADHETVDAHALGFLTDTDVPPRL